MCGITYQMSVPSFKLIFQNMYKKSRKIFVGGESDLAPPSECFCPPEDQKLHSHDENQQGKTLTV